MIVAGRGEEDPRWYPSVVSCHPLQQGLRGAMVAGVLHELHPSVDSGIRTHASNRRDTVSPPPPTLNPGTGGLVPEEELAARNASFIWPTGRAFRPDLHVHDHGVQDGQTITGAMMDDVVRISLTMSAAISRCRSAGIGPGSGNARTLHRGHGRAELLTTMLESM